MAPEEEGRYDFPRTMELLEADVAEGLFTLGAQVAVSFEGERVFETCLGDDGFGRPVELDTIFRVYCTIKPVTAMAIANLVDAGGVELDRPLVEVLGTRPVLERGVTARQLLNHTAGLHNLSAFSMELVPPEDRRRIIDRQLPPPGWHVGRDAGYSEFAAWTMLGELLETVTGEPLREHLRRTVLDPLGMHDTWIGMTPAEYAANVGRMGVNVDLRGFRPFPMLMERSERVCVETNPAHGGYTTARDLDRLFCGLLQVLGGGSVDGLPSPATMAQFCSTARPSSFDVVLDRRCDYGLGFMTNLADHYFGGRCSPESFGHSGNVGSSFAFADPMHHLSVAVVFNGLVDHESAFVRRPALVRAMYLDLEQVDDEDAEPGDTEKVDTGRRRGLLRSLRRSR